MKKHIIRAIFIVVTASVLNSCGLAYYFEQSIPGHFSLMLKMKEIDLVIRSNVNENTKQKLKTVLKARHFASTHLSLPENESYTYYADIDRPYVTWNVVASPSLSLKPKTWCYFIIGCAVYRGYFNEEDAKAEAQSLVLQGYDVHIGGATAYSTLGFFIDPVLSTMIKWQDFQLAGIIFHELSHQELYIKNDTAFNEAFATSVELIGTTQWILSEQAHMMNEFLAAISRAEEFRLLKKSVRDELSTLYESNQNTEFKLARKKEIFQEMQKEYERLKTIWGKPYYDSWFNMPLNNARLISDAAYWQHVPAFLALYVDSKLDWRTFFESCKTISELNKKEREARFLELEAKGVGLNQILEILRQNTPT
ncbi:MAG: aminopeptidase [Gammaproteobacteria bacterium]|nr:aminopeptidase [Gammaproteobacteria bacterium]